jgi:hypothetical protein
MKNKFYFFLIFILLFIVQCKRSYISTIENYFKYLKNQETKKAYNLLSIKDKNIISYEEYQKESYATPISKNISKRIKYKIISSHLSESKKYVVIKVEITQPDLVKIYTLLPELLNNKIDEKRINKIFSSNKNIIKNNSIVNIKDYKLVLEKNEWKIFADFEKKKYIYNLINRADQFYEKKDYNTALINYQRVLDFEQNDRAIDRIRIIKEKLDYIKKYLIINYNILEKYKNGVIIDIAIKNIGTIVVKNVIVDFLFCDNEVQLYKERHEIIDNIDQKIGYNKEIRKKVVIKNYTTGFTKIDCIISAIEF